MIVVKTKTKKSLSISFVILLLFAGISFVFLTQTASALTYSVANLSTIITGSGFQPAVDFTNGYLYVAVGICSNVGAHCYLYRINLDTVLATPAASVASFGNPFPFSSAGSVVGNLAGGPNGLVFLNGLLYTSAVYNTGKAIAVTNPSTNATTVYYYPSSYTGFMPLSTDGLRIYTNLGPYIVVFDPSTHGFSTISTSPCYPTTILPDGSKLWMGCISPYGLASMNNDGSGLSVFSGGFTGADVAKDSSGNVWITSNVSHTLNECVSPCSGNPTFNTYPTGLTFAPGFDGPYGLTITAAGIQIGGYGSNSVINFNTSTHVFTTLASGLSKKPYRAIVDSSNNAWWLSLGSTDLVMIPATTSGALTTYTLSNIIEYTSRSGTMWVTVSGTGTATSTAPTTSASTSMTTTTATTALSIVQTNYATSSASVSESDVLLSQPLSAGDCIIAGGITGGETVSLVDDSSGNVYASQVADVTRLDLSMWSARVASSSSGGTVRVHWSSPTNGNYWLAFAYVIRNSSSCTAAFNGVGSGTGSNSFSTSSFVPASGSIVIGAVDTAAVNGATAPGTGFVRDFQGYQNFAMTMHAISDGTSTICPASGAASTTWDSICASYR